MKRSVSEKSELLEHFEELYSVFSRDEMDGIADLLYQEVDLRFQAGQTTEKIHLAVMADSFKMRGTDVVECIKIMERKYAKELAEMGYVISVKHDNYDTR